MNVAKYLGPVFSLVMCSGMAVTCLYTLFGTELPLVMPIVTGGIAVISGIMVATDVKKVWWPLLTGKPVS